ncbi:MAG: hypothetical protein ABFD92_03910 [Planctomycetaceae bacterium]|nr:hypothetical protein [Planctomycetaceae bacterium]
MSSNQPPYLCSGAYEGWWRQAQLPVGRMVLTIVFSDTGLRATGQDWVGCFRMSGDMTGDSFRGIKHYATHWVEYLGRIQRSTADGSVISISGEWRTAGGETGPFRIWLAGSGEDGEHLMAREDVDVPVSCGASESEGSSVAG